MASTRLTGAPFASGRARVDCRAQPAWSEGAGSPEPASERQDFSRQPRLEKGCPQPRQDPLDARLDDLAESQNIHRAAKEAIGDLRDMK